MKKIVSIFIALIMAFSMSACGSNQGSTDPTTHESTTTEMKSTEKSTTEEKTEETTENLEPLEILDFGYSSTELLENKIAIHYGVKIKNPNPEYAIEFLVIYITAKDIYGQTIYKDFAPLSAIAAGDTIMYGGTSFYEGDYPYKVEVSVESGMASGGYVLQEQSKAIYQDELVVSDVSEQKSNNGAAVTFTGNVTNTSKKDMTIKYPVSVVFYKDNKIIGGFFGYYEALKSGDTTQFELNVSYLVEELRDYDYYEIYVGQ